jgi:Kef-type K+ transport system membrane component KefB
MILKHVCTILYPILFGCIGASVDLYTLNPIYIGIGVGIYIFSMMTRFLATLIVGCISRYNIKEILFIAFAWMPKGTVTATLGSVIYT